MTCQARIALKYEYLHKIV